MLIGRTTDLLYLLDGIVPIHEYHGERLESIIRLQDGKYEFKLVGQREQVETVVAHWRPVEEFTERDFVSVLGYMTDAGDFPPVRECYKIGDKFFFPALGGCHQISHWMPMPTRNVNE